jgi:hypothetical protein
MKKPPPQKRKPAAGELPRPEATPNGISAAASAAAAIPEAEANRDQMDPRKPRVALRSNLTLTTEKEEELLTFVRNKRDTIKRDTGWISVQDLSSYAHGQAGGGSAADPFMLGNLPKLHFERRSLFLLTAESKMEWRRWLYPKTIYERSNLTVPVARRIANGLIAKTTKAVLGTSPVFCAKEKNSGPDQRKATNAQKCIDTKADESSLNDAIRLGIQQAFYLGEAVVKVTYERDITLWKTVEEVMTDAAANPILGKDGLYITARDTFQMGEGGIRVLARDGVTVIPDGAAFTRGSWANMQVHYEGPKASVLDFRHLLADTRELDLQSAGYVCHTYRTTADKLASQFRWNGGNALTVKELFAGAAEISDTVRSSPHKSNDPALSAVTAGEITIYESYVRCDVDGDGVTEDILIVEAELNEGGTTIPVIYEYVANATKTRRRPFFPIRPIPRLNSWTGIGAIEMYEQIQSIVDLMANRWNFAVSGSGTITCYDPEAFEETSGRDGAEADLKLNNGALMRLKPGKILENSIKRIYLEDNIGPEWRDLMQFFIQLAMNESGIMHANDGAAIGLESTRTATGIRNLENAGNEMFSVFLGSIEAGIKQMAVAWTDTLFKTITDEEIREITEDAEATAADFARWRYDITVQLSTFRNEQQLAAAAQAWPLLKDYYASPLIVQLRARPIMEKTFAALQMDCPPDTFTPFSPVLDAETVQMATRVAQQLGSGPESASILNLLAIAEQAAMAAAQQQSAPPAK